MPVCLIYIGVHSLFRAVFGKKRAIFFADIAFSVTATVVSFFFMVFYNNGQVRLHLFMGEALGFFVFMRTVGRHISFLCFYAADMLHNVAGKLLYPFLRVGRAFVNIFSQAVGKIRTVSENKRADNESDGENGEKVEINSKKLDFIGKILLKIKNKSV